MSNLKVFYLAKKNFINDSLNVVTFKLSLIKFFFDTNIFNMVFQAVLHNIYSAFMMIYLTDTVIVSPVSHTLYQMF